MCKGLRALLLVKYLKVQPDSLLPDGQADGIAVTITT